MTDAVALHAAEETLEAVRTRRYASYPAYKTSDVEWLGDVPEHWKLVPLKYLCKFSGGLTPSSSNADYWDGTIPWVSPKDMKSWRISDTEDHVTELAVRDVFRSLLEPGAVLLVVRSGILRHSLPVAINDVSVVFNQDIKALVARKQLSNEYLARLIEGNQKPLLRLWTKPGTTVESIESEYLLNESIPVPPPDEQQAIARFLDDQTRKINELIEAKRGLLDLLKEKRQAVITHAVTRGLDPAAKLKPSGAEWLRDVPEHWELKPFKHLTRFLNGMAFKPDQWSDEGCPIIRIENLNGGNSFNCFEGEVPHQYHVRQGDLLFGWSGNRGTSFGPFLWWREGLHYLNQHIFKLHAYKCDKSWFYWTLKSLTKYMEEEAHGIIGMVHITKGKLGAVKVPVPPLKEQRAIARFLDEETEKMDDLESVVREAIASLELLRASIISAAVTGKIDVRGAAVRARP